jgi:hypothetical protein
MSLVEATARKKEEFVKAAAIPETPAWAEEQAGEEVEVEIPRAPAPQRVAQPAVRITRAAPLPVEMSPRKKTTFNIDAALHRRLKLTAVRQEREIVDIVEEALVSHLRAIDRTAAE